MWMNLNSRTLEKQYKEKLSDFREWEERVDEQATHRAHHAEES